jgi:hypothetical protein
MSELFTRGRDFIYRDGRLLERRLFARLFEGGPASAVVDCLRSYRNTDGGLGHALEPDKRAPESQPLDVQIALDTLDAAGTFDAGLVGSACDFLESVADERGAVPVVLPSIADYPRAHHWRDGNFPPGPSPAVGIAALLYKHGFEHAWRERASDYCWSVIENEPPDDAHALRECMAFVEHAPDRTRAEAAANGLAEALGKARWFNADADYDGYGLTPLHFATTPHSRWRALFADEQIEAHLKRLADDQEDDGGWPLSWQPPSEAARIEWRGIETLRALRILAAYGKAPCAIARQCGPARVR